MVSSVLRTASVAVTEKELPASEQEKVNEALFCFTVPEGPEPMVVSGSVVSCGGETRSR